MRKCAKSISEVKDYVNGLMGSQLKISVNKGRKKILRYSGSVLAVYPKVFTLKISSDKNIDILSCSYSDLICGDIKLSAAGSAR